MLTCKTTGIFHVVF